MNKIQGLFGRYLLILILGLNISVFYYLFTLPTLYFSEFLISIFQPATIMNNFIVLQYSSIEVISACIGGSAFYLLTILIMSVPNVKTSKRITLMGISFLSLFLFNCLRIVLMSFFIGYPYFEEIHMFFWRFLSTLFVIFLWFLIAYIFKIKDIPIYTDIKFLIKKIR